MHIYQKIKVAVSKQPNKAPRYVLITSLGAFLMPLVYALFQLIVS